MTLFTTFIGLFLAYLFLISWILANVRLRIWIFFEESTAAFPALVLTLLHLWAAGLLGKF